jgi:hypothetical protein
MLNIIIKNARNLMHLTDDILDLTRIGGKISVLNREKIDFYPYLLNFTKDAKSFCRKKTTTWNWSSNITTKSFWI